MATNFNALLATMSPDRLARIEAKTEALRKEDAARKAAAAK